MIRTQPEAALPATPPHQPADRARADISFPASFDPGPGAARLAADPVLAGQLQRVWDLRALDVAPGELVEPAPLSLNHLAELACEQYRVLADAGQQVDLAVFCACFAPELREEVRLQLSMEELLADPNYLQAGDEIQGLTLLRELGRGCFARVFLACQTNVGGRTVVVKVTPGKDEEGRVLGQVEHENTVPVLDILYDAASNSTLLCMPYLGTVTLAQALSRLFVDGSPAPTRGQALLDAARPLQPVPRLPASHRLLRHGAYLDAALHVGTQLADGLHSLHEQGICHRDLKPANVLLRPDGVPLLMDFNLARSADGQPKWFGGTLPYMAPEHLLASEKGSGVDSRVVDTRADVYALGVILCELLTGRHPFGPLPRGLSEKDLRALLLERQREGLQALPLDGEVAAILRRCLARDADERPTAAEVGTALRRALSTRARLSRWLVRHRRPLVMAACLGGAVLLAGAAWFASLPPYAERMLRHAQQVTRQGQLAEALRVLDALLAAQPDNRDAYFARARVKHQLGQWAPAVADYQAAASRGEDPRIDLCLAYCLAHSRQHAQAVHHADLAEQAGLVVPALYVNRAWSHYKKATLAAAENDLNQALKLDPRLQVAHHLRALIRLQQARNEPPKPAACLAGIADVRTALALGPGSAGLHRDAACLFATAAANDAAWVAEAVQHAQKAVELGIDPAALARDRCLEALKQDPLFQNLVAQPAAPRPGRPQGSSYLRDPLEELNF